MDLMAVRDRLLMEERCAVYSNSSTLGHVFLHYRHDTAECMTDIVGCLLFQAKSQQWSRVYSLDQGCQFNCRWFRSPLWYGVDAGVMLEIRLSSPVGLLICLLIVQRRHVPHQFICSSSSGLHSSSMPLSVIRYRIRYSLFTMLGPFDARHGMA